MHRSVATFVALLLSAGSFVCADVISTSATFDPAPASRDYLHSDTYFAGYFAGARIPVTGLEKFDPNLGILTGVALTVSFDYTYEFTLTSGPVIDAGQPHSSQVDYDSMRFVVGYRPGQVGNTTLLENTAHSNLTLTASGAAGDPPATQTLNGGGTVQANLKDITASVDLANFVGIGEVDSLLIASYLPYSGTFTINNLASASANVQSQRTGGTISLQYTYDVPEPAGMGLIAVAAFAGLRRRRA